LWEIRWHLDELGPGADEMIDTAILTVLRHEHAVVLAET
jgi:hypothetical protein